MAEIPSTLINSLDRISKWLEDDLRAKREMRDFLSTIASSIRPLETNVYQKAEENVKKLAQTIQSTSDEIKTTSALEEISRKYLKKAINNSISETKELKQAFSLFSKSFREMAQAFAEGRKSFHSLLSNFSRFGGYIGKAVGGAALFVKTLESNINLYRKLISSGLDFDGGLLEMRKMFADIGLRTDEAIDTLLRNVSVFNILGEKRFKEFADAIDMTSANLVALGMTYEETKKWSIEYLAIQRNLSALRRLSAEEQAESFDRTMEEFYKATSYFGTNVRTFVDTFKKISEDPDTRMAIIQLPESGRRLFSIIENHLPKEMVNVVREGILRGTIARADEYTDLLIAGLAPTASRLVNILRDPNATIEDVIRVIKETSIDNERISRLYLAGLTKQANIASSFALEREKIAEELNQTLTLQERAGKTVTNIMEKIRELNIAVYDLQSKLLEKSIEMSDKFPALAELIVKMMDLINKFLASPLPEIIDFTFNALYKIHSFIRSFLGFITAPLGVSGGLLDIVSGGLVLYLVSTSKRFMFSMLSSTKSMWIKLLGSILKLLGRFLLTRIGIITGIGAGVGYLASRLFGTNEEEKPETISTEKTEEIPSEIPLPEISAPTPPSPAAPVPPAIPKPKTIISTKPTVPVLTVPQAPTPNSIAKKIEELENMADFLQEQVALTTENFNKVLNFQQQTMKMMESILNKTAEMDQQGKSISEGLKHINRKTE